MYPIANLVLSGTSKYTVTWYLYMYLFEVVVSRTETTVVDQGVYSLYITILYKYYDELKPPDSMYSNS